jgi:cyclophilin family peptidyl-prolyl cis-trans isomerase
MFLYMSAFLFAAMHRGGGDNQIRVELEHHKVFVITTEERKAPRTVAAILALVRSRFYDGQKFHRVENWVVQWGDPQSRTLPINDIRLGDGGTGRKLAFEKSDVDFTRGAVGIASKRKGAGGDSQIFILRKSMPRLNHGYAILGWVTSGMNVVDHIKLGDRIVSMRIVGN